MKKSFILITSIFFLLPSSILAQQSGQKEIDKAKELFNKMDFEGSIINLEKASQLGNSDAMVMLGNLYTQSKEFDVAINWYQQAIKTDTNGFALFHLAQIYLAPEPSKYNDKKKAKLLLTDLMKLSTKDARLIKTQMEAEALLNDWKE